MNPNLNADIPAPADDAPKEPPAPGTPTPGTPTPGTKSKPISGGNRERLAAMLAGKDPVEVE